MLLARDFTVYILEASRLFEMIPSQAAPIFVFGKVKVNGLTYILRPGAFRSGLGNGDPIAAGLPRSGPC